MSRPLAFVPLSVALSSAILASASAQGIINQEDQLDPVVAKPREFGRHVAISGNTAVIADYLEGTRSTYSGAVYVYRLRGGMWEIEQQLTGSDVNNAKWFGESLALHGNWLAVGAPRWPGGQFVGAVYVFRRDRPESLWYEVQRLEPTDPRDEEFGTSVATDGKTLVAGANEGDQGNLDTGAAYIFERTGDRWTPVQRLRPDDLVTFDQFGNAVGVNGDLVVVGAEKGGPGEPGAVYVYRRIAGNWYLEQKLFVDQTTWRQFGAAVAVHPDEIIVGAPGEDQSTGAVYTYLWNGTVWEPGQRITAPDQNAADFFGYSLAAHGNRMVVGAYSANSAVKQSGAAYVLRRDRGWHPEWKLLLDSPLQGDQFGMSVAFDGRLVLCGADGRRAAFTFAPPGF